MGEKVTARERYEARRRAKGRPAEWAEFRRWWRQFCDETEPFDILKFVAAREDGTAFMAPQGV